MPGVLRRLGSFLEDGSLGRLQPSREPPSRHAVVPRYSAALAVEAQMATARGQHRHRQARPVNCGVAVCRNPWVIQRVKDQRWPRDVGDEMLGGIAFVIVAGTPVAEARRDEAIVEFIDGPDSGDGGSLGGADCGARRQGLAFHRIEHVALIDEVAAA